MRGLWLFLHVTAAFVWIGGMFFVLHCLRPALAELQPQLRAPLLVQTLTRFFRYVVASIVLLWFSGLLLLAPVGMKAAPVGWHLMIALAAAMTVIFAIIQFGPFRRAAAAVARADYPVAGAALDRVRLLVMINLALGLAILAAVSGWG